MSVLRCAAVIVALSALSAAPLRAADTVTGRWAVDPAWCWSFGATAAQSPLIVTDTALRWSADACRIGRSYKTGNTVHIQAYCWGEGGEKSIPVSLHPRGKRLSVTWDRGTRSDLQRCP
jgi:hypothetical protein